ncbi:MAG: prephenate dehydratase [Peptococcaceae bacterium]|jgi:prephenate dehydratase|nr:prephenate dehydratase [Peptococcaceae bacterium]
MKVGYLGPKGTFSEEAASRYFAGVNAALYPFPTILDVLDEVETGAIDKGIVPIENTIEGSITFAVDRLTESEDLFVQGELILEVAQNLLGNAQVPLEELREIWSIQPALAQCRQLIRGLQVSVKNFDSTASAALAVKESGRTDVAAIASSWAARQLGLEIVADHIQDTASNQTRFVVVVKGKQILEQPRKTMMVLLPNHERSGVLMNILHVFYALDLNLTWIESRPTKKQLGTYQFYLDVESPLQDERMGKALSILQTLGHQVRVLGSY